MNVLFSFVEMFVNKVLIYNMSLVRCLWTWQWRWSRHDWARYRPHCWVELDVDKLRVM